MVVLFQVRIETGSFVPATGRHDQAQIPEQPECSVDRIKRNPRQSAPDTLEDLLGIRVVISLGNLAKDLDSLMRYLDAFFATDRFKKLYAPIDFCV